MDRVPIEVYESHLLGTIRIISYLLYYFQIYSAFATRRYF